MVNRRNTGGEPSVLVLAGGWVLDPGRWDGEADVWIKDGVIDAVVSPDAPPPQAADGPAHRFLNQFPVSFARFKN